jgi:hypothetical protein
MIKTGFRNFCVAGFEILIANDACRVINVGASRVILHRIIFL